MKPCFIDIHCHLDLCKDIDGCVKRCKENDVGIIVAQGTNPETNRIVLELAEKYKEVKVALGLYPIDALDMKDDEIDKELKFIRKNKDKIVAIGEVGIDFKGMEPSFQTSLADRERQIELFKKIVRLSISIDKPLIIHSRKAEFEVVELLEKENAKKVIMHCFCGNKKLVERILKNGWYLTVPTSVVRSQQFQEIALNSNINQLFCETDAPFLHPDKLENNEPVNVIRSYEKIAELRNIKLEDVKKRIFDNYSKLFDISL